MKENHILPFVWMRGEEEDVIRTELEKIDQAGIHAVCLEARPHPEYAGEKWWHDVDIVIDEAKRRNMQIWILDDAHFPTGMANDGMKKHTEKARRFLYTQFVDVTGPVPACQLDVDLMLTKQFTWMDLGKPQFKPLYDETTLLSVTASQICDGDLIQGEVLNLTGSVKDGYLTADIPAGTWRLNVNFSTTAIGSKPEYINYIEADSVRVLIDEVYEKHYERYADLFGTVIAGFFSDEPGFYNKDGYDANNFLGLHMPLPWGKEMDALMKKEYGPNLYRDITLLYSDEKNGAHRAIRTAYMDAVTRLYSKNFNYQLGNWCRDHGVAYIGHIVEDSCGHMRLGAGAGHYFRAMAGQDIAGIDNIGYQLMPGNEIANRHTGFQDLEPEFYHYELAKLGSSAAAIDPRKKGRTMCENFGAYGWRLGVRDMKWLVDYLICQGVNYFVPHAFSMAAYPDSDCPPHFYARGNNPQFPYFCDLMGYTDRLCNLFSDGQNVPQVAVLYEAESDWAGKTMPGHVISKKLLNRQIDFEFLPADVFAEPDRYQCEVKENALIVNGRAMKALIIPRCEYLPAPAAEFIAAHPEVTVLFVNALPMGITGRMKNATAAETDAAAANALLRTVLCSGECVALDDLADRLTEMGATDELRIEGADANLHQYHYRKDGKEIWMLMNASLSETVEIAVHLPSEHSYGCYDAMTDMTRSVSCDEQLTIPPYGSVVIVSDPENPLPREMERKAYETLSLDRFDLKLQEIGKNTPDEICDFTPVPVSSIRRDFSGTLVYKTEINLDARPAKAVFFAQYVYECMSVIVNGIKLPSVLTPPYTADLTDALQTGNNTLEIHVATTALRNANLHPGIFGKERTVIEPTGMFGEIGITLMK